jgi:hypothetical protein
MARVRAAQEEAAAAAQGLASTEYAAAHLAHVDSQARDPRVQRLVRHMLRDMQHTAPANPTGHAATTALQSQMAADRSARPRFVPVQGLQKHLHFAAIPDTPAEESETAKSEEAAVEAAFTHVYADSSPGAEPSGDTLLEELEEDGDQQVGTSGPKALWGDLKAKKRQGFPWMSSYSASVMSAQQEGAEAARTALAEEPSQAAQDDKPHKEGDAMQPVVEETPAPSKSQSHMQSLTHATSQENFFDRFGA